MFIAPAFQKLMIDILYYIILCFVEWEKCYSKCSRFNSSILLTLSQFFTLSFFEELIELHLSLQSNLVPIFYASLAGLIAHMSPVI